MIILGIDPGSRITGFGLVKKDGNRVTHIENGSLYCADQETFARRLVYLFEEIQKIIRKFKPDVMVVENIFYHKNPKSVQKLGEARGAIILSGSLAGLPIHEYTALQVKQAVTGYGKAAKEQVQGMVRKLLNLPDLAEENASDALGIALCHAHSTGRFLLVSKGQTGEKGRGTAGRARELLKQSSFYR